MNNDPGIICFTHCSSNIFAFALPEQCPSCNEVLSKNPVFPFRIPYPFVRASQNPCAVVLKPTQGDFLREYTNTHDLHIGITDSRGVVYAYDERGLNSGQGNEWEQCLSVQGLETSRLGPMEDRFDSWDTTLYGVTRSNSWTSESYKEDGLNCYSFVLTCLQKLQLGSLSESARDKERFCQKVLLPLTTTAAQYISLFRQVSSHGVLVRAVEQRSN